MKKIQKRLIDQIFQEIVSVLTTQRDLIVLLCKLESEDIALHVMSSKAQAVLEKSQTWVKKIASSAHVVCRSFAILAHDIHIILNISNQKMIIKRLIKNNTRLHEDLKMLRIAWLKKIVESEKIHSSLIVEITIETMTNWLLDVDMLNSYQECSCKLFEKNCRITQCYKCFDFDHIARFCKNEERCFKCADIDWSRQVESSRSNQVLDSSRFDSSQNSWLEYSSQVKMFNLSIQVESESWNWVSTWNSRLNSSRHEDR